MANFTISPNMNLVIPTPGQDPGPDYATNNSNSLTIIDGHNHSSGSGVQINPNGIDINSDLPINSNNLTLVRTINYAAISAPLSGVAPNLGCTYVSGNELYYNDEAGNVVQITNNGSVNAGAGSITGLPSGTASASYSAGTFVWQSATNTSANMDAGSYVYRNNTVNSKGITVSAPNALAADLQIFWPGSFPGAQSFMTLDSSGNMAAPWTVDNSTLQVSSNLVQIKAHGVTQGLLQNMALGSTVGTGGFAVSASCGSFGCTAPGAQITNLSVTITTTGRPVRLGLMPDGGNNAYIAASSDQLEIFIQNGVTVISSELFYSPSGGAFWPVASINCIDTSVNGVPGTYTYTVHDQIAAGSATVNYAVLYAYEI